MNFTFTPESEPYLRWKGPFSPSRGKYTSLRVRGGGLKAYFDSKDESASWELEKSAGIQSLVDTVTRVWGGGRVMLLPTGHVIKPLQDQEVGIRKLIGRFTGPLIFRRHDGGSFDLDLETNRLAPGDLWHGIKNIGVECIIQEGGVLSCRWYHPTVYGKEEIRIELLHDSPERHIAFQKARQGDTYGRVHVLPNGAVITNHQTFLGEWEAKFVCKISPSSWGSWEHWIGDET